MSGDLSNIVFEKLFDAIADMAKALINQSNFDEATKSVLTTSISSICDVLSSIKQPVSGVDNNKKKDIPKKAPSVVTPLSTHSRTRSQLKRVMHEPPPTGKQLLSKTSKTSEMDRSPKTLPTSAETKIVDNTTSDSSTSQTNGGKRPLSKHLKLAVRPKSMFISGLDIETTIDDIKDYASQFFDNDIMKDLKVLKINSKSNTYVSFKLFCPPDLFDDFLKIWKNEGILARPFTDDYVNHASKKSSPKN